MRRIINNFCFPGLVVLAILNVLYYLFTNLDKVREWPGFSTLNALFTRNPLQRLVLIWLPVFVRLENNAHRKHERLYQIARYHPAGHIPAYAYIVLRRE